MDSYTVRYEFSQGFDVSAGEAFRWCTDYRADDWELMGKKGTRRIAHINEDTLILTDTVEMKAGASTKKRLVRLNPERLAWTNTHLTGANKHSQFWYQIVEEGRAKSRLDFSGMQVYYGPRPSPQKLSATSRELKDEDAGMWKLLARAMNRELGRPQK